MRCTDLNLLVQDDGDQRGSVFKCEQAVCHATRQMQELACAHQLRPTFGGELEAPFEALNGDLARDLVGRHNLAHRKNEAHDLKLTGLEQGESLRRGHSASK